MNLEIISEVAFKGAVDLAVSGKIEVSEIETNTEKYFNLMVKLSSKSQPQFNKTIDSSNSSGSSEKITQKQIPLLNRLAQENGLDIDVYSMTKAEASKKIDELIGNK